MAAVLAGCGAAEDQGAQALEDAIEGELGADADVSVDPDDQSITLDDDDGSFTMGTDLDAPDWLDPALPHPADLAFDTVLAVDGISSVRGTTALTAPELADFYIAAIDDLGWSLDDSTPPTADFFQLFVTDGDGQELDIEYVGGKLSFVIGRTRPE